MNARQQATRYQEMLGKLAYCVMRSNITNGLDLQSTSPKTDSMPHVVIPATCSLQRVLGCFMESVLGVLSTYGLCQWGDWEGFGVNERGLLGVIRSGSLWRWGKRKIIPWVFCYYLRVCVLPTDVTVLLVVYFFDRSRPVTPAFHRYGDDQVQRVSNGPNKLTQTPSLSCKYARRLFI